MVYNLALQYLQNIEESEEICQDVFISAHQHLAKFNQESSYSTWLYRITINKCLDHLKAKKRLKRFAFIQSIFVGESNNLAVEGTEFNHPGVQLEQKQEVQQIFKALDLLNDQQKTAIILHKIEGLSQAQISEIMGISKKAVESLVQRAKQNLKNILIKEGIQV